MLPHEKALVGGIDDKGVVKQSVFLQVLIHPSDVAVDGVYHGAVVPHVALVFPLIEVPALQGVFLELLDDGVIIGIPEGLLGVVHPSAHHFPLGEVLAVQAASVGLQVGIVGGVYFTLLVRHLEVIDYVHVLYDAHFLECRYRPRCVVVVKGTGQRIGYVVIDSEVLRIRHPASVRGLVVQDEEERLFLVPTVHPLHRHVRCDVGTVSPTGEALPVPDENGIVVVALSSEDVPVVKPGWVAHEVPLAYHCSLVAGCAEQFWKGLLASVEDAVLIVREPVLVAVLSRNHAGPRGTGQGVCHEGVRETCPLVCEAVDVGRGNEAPVIGADGLVGMVIAHDVDYIHGSCPFLILHCAGACGHECRGSRECNQ